MIETKRLILRELTDADYDDPYEFLSQLENDEFEGYPGITYENGKEHMKYRISSDEFLAIELKDTGKVIGNIYCGKREYDTRELGYIVNRNYQHLRQNIYFHKDENDIPKWKDTYVYAKLNDNVQA